MPQSTRANPCEPTNVELSTAQRDLRLRLRTTSAEALRLAEDNDDNGCFGVVYTPEILRLMLLAYTDDFGKIRPADKAAVRLLFRERSAWKLGTHFRTVWCAINLLQVGQKSKDGWTCDQIAQQNQNSYNADLSLVALLCQVCTVLIAFVLLSCDTP